MKVLQIKEIEVIKSCFFEGACMFNVERLIKEQNALTKPYSEISEEVVGEETKFSVNKLSAKSTE